MKALIFAAGLGTRLKPITDRIPKALVPICGKPLLQHIVDKLKKAGFTELVINVHHFADLIQQYISDNGDFGVDVSLSDETDLLRETGGGIRHAAKFLNGSEPFLVHNVDILSNLDIAEFVRVHNDAVNEASLSGKAAPLATLLVSDRQTQRYLLFDSNNNMVGWMNIKTGEVRSPYVELCRKADIVSQQDDTSVYTFDYQHFLNIHNLKKYAFDGAHVISPQIFGVMEQMPEKFSIIDFYIEHCDRYNIKYHIQPDLEMVDVGKLDSLEKAEELAKKMLM